MELTGKTIHFLGDSITEGCGVSSKEKIFLNLMAAREGFAARNYGLSGTCMARRRYVPHDPIGPCFCDRIDGMAPGADLIVVFGGTNDYGHGTAPMGQPSDRTPDTFWGACHYLIRALYEKYPSAGLVFIPPLHNLSEVHGCPGQYNVRPLGDFVRIIRTVCEQYSVPVCDLYGMSGLTPDPEDSRMARYMPDGLHPNDAGHARIAARLTGFLRAL